MNKRFERLARLIKEDGVRTLSRKHVMVCGMGGVGSWCAEALARSALGRLTLVDFDVVSITNSNRQLPAVTPQLGIPKVVAMKQRLLEINPELEVDARILKIDESSLEALLDLKPDFVVDAIDQLRNKCHLLVSCRRSGIPVIMSGGAGGRFDPTLIRVSDLAEVGGDRLCFWTRRYLKKEHDLRPRKSEVYGIRVVHSLEPAQDPWILTMEDAEPGKRELRQKGLVPEPGKYRNLVMGTACFVTSVFGMTAAAEVVQTLLKQENAELHQC